MRARIALILTILGLAMAVSAAPVLAGDPPPVIVVAMVDAPDPVLAGGVLTYTITVQNPGPVDVFGVQVEAFIPSGTSFQSMGSTQAVGNGSFNCCTGGTQAVWGIDSLPVGVQEVLTLGVFVDLGVSPGTVIPNTALAEASGFNQVQLTAETTVLAPLADLSITKTDSPDPVLPGGTITYTITLENAGNVPLTDVIMLDVWPAGTSSPDASVTAGGIFVVGPNGSPGNAFEWEIASLAVGASETMTMTVVVEPGTAAGTVISNMATAESNETEPVEGTAQSTVGAGVTPAASLVNAATPPPGPGTSWAALSFAALLIGALGVLVVANARGVARRR